MEAMTCWKCGGDAVLTQDRGDELALVDVGADGVPSTTLHTH